MQALNYFKRHWPEITGSELTELWGTSDFWFETDGEFKILKQLQIFENGNCLKYDATYSEDKFGGLSELPLDAAEFKSYQIGKDEFEEQWIISVYRQFPEIVITENILWGQPRLDGRRLAVGDIVSQIDIEDNLGIALETYAITLQEARQALHYCRTLQCVKDEPLKFCHNCTLRVQQNGDAEGDEQDNWKRAERLFNEYFTS